MEQFSISTLCAGTGRVGICPIPGRAGAYGDDLHAMLDWAPQLVLSMTELAEMTRVGAAGLGDDLGRAGVQWRHLPIRDFGVLEGETRSAWPGVAAQVRGVWATGGGVLVHCFGGCGRSGMAILRLMVEQGEHPDAALIRLRGVRACAVETEDQFAWAAAAAG